MKAPSNTNRLLQRLPSSDRTHLLARCERVQLAYADVLAEPGEKIRDLYFPTASYISLQKPIDGEGTFEIALAGSEGLYGASVALGSGVSAVHARVRGAGDAWRISAASFLRELARIPALRDGTDLYIHVLMAQLAQGSGCSNYHRVEPRLARSLLATSDRAHSPTFRITHESLAGLLGVRRVGITEAAGALQGRNLIDYSRGAMEILDRTGLELAACSCYRSDLEAYEAVLG